MNVGEQLTATSKYRVELVSEDGKPITPRTGVNKIVGTAALSQPLEGIPFIVMYDPDQSIHSDPSPGMITWPVFVEKIGNEYRYRDEEGRPFLVRYL